VKTTKGDADQTAVRARDFFNWERTTWDTLDLKLTYVDMVDGDFQTAILLAQLVYWTVIPTRRGETKLQVVREGRHWLVKSASEIYSETRLTRRQSDKAILKLKNLGIISVEVHKWGPKGGHQAPTRHLAMNEIAFFLAWEKAAKAAEKGF
jgi:hypothetical protein